MAILNVIIEYAVALMTGFFGHVIAHDFCEVAPMISVKIVEFAASWLPAPIRDRYVNEWRADLFDQPGALAKIAWALGCLKSVYRMRREAKFALGRRLTVQFSLDNGEVVLLNWPTLMAVDAAIKFASWSPNWFPGRITAVAMLLGMLEAKFAWRRSGSADISHVMKFLKRIAAGEKLTKVTCYLDGVPDKIMNYPNGAPEIVDADGKISEAR